MGIFKKLFTADPVALEHKADELFEAGDFGSAKLTYDRALAALPDPKPAALLDKRARCTDAIAKGRIAEATSYLQDGALELAEQELEGALEVAASPAIVEEAQRLLDGLEARDAQQQSVAHETTDEERLALLAGQWQDAQADEYEALGQPLFDALVAMQTDRVDEAAAALERMVKEADEPRYVWLELGRARLLGEDLPGGKEALEHFVSSLGADEGGETRLIAQLSLARLSDEAGDFEEAMRHFEQAVQAMPEDYRPYLAMGAFLREKNHLPEALDVLDTALELSLTAGPDWRLFEELGLTHEAAGKPEEAQRYLEQVVDLFTRRQAADLPQQSVTTLARLHENAGRLDRAANLYRALTQGEDRANHGRYYFEAGRLLQELGLREDARRMLTRAEALAPEDPELAELIAARLQAL